MIKHKRLLAVRQAIPILSFISAILLFFFGFYKVLSSLIILYIILITGFSITLGPFKNIPYYLIGFIGSHFFWTTGIMISPIKYFSNLRKKND